MIVLSTQIPQITQQQQIHSSVFMAEASQADVEKWGYVSDIETSLQMGMPETRWKIKVLLSVN